MVNFNGKHTQEPISVKLLRCAFWGHPWILSCVSCRLGMKSMLGKTLTPVWMQPGKSCLSLGPRGPKTGCPLGANSYLLSIRQSSKDEVLPGTAGSTWEILWWVPPDSCGSRRRKTVCWGEKGKCGLGLVFLALCCGLWGPWVSTQVKTVSPPPQLWTLYNSSRLIRSQKELSG